MTTIFVLIFLLHLSWQQYLYWFFYYIYDDNNICIDLFITFVMTTIFVLIFLLHSSWQQYLYWFFFITFVMTTIFVLIFSLHLSWQQCVDFFITFVITIFVLIFSLHLSWQQCVDFFITFVMTTIFVLIFLLHLSWQQYLYWFFSLHLSWQQYLCRFFHYIHHDNNNWLYRSYTRLLVNSIIFSSHNELHELIRNRFMRVIFQIHTGVNRVLLQYSFFSILAILLFCYFVSPFSLLDNNSQQHRKIVWTTQKNSLNNTEK